MKTPPSGGSAKPVQVIARPQFAAEIGARIREGRRKRGLALVVVADEAGISVATLSRLETGKQPLGIALLVVLSKIIDIPVASLLGGPEGHADAQTLIRVLVDMCEDERRRVFRAVQAELMNRLTISALFDSVSEDLVAASEKLRAINVKITRPRLRRVIHRPRLRLR